MQCPLLFGPCFRENFRDLAVGHVGQAREDFPQVLVRIKIAPPATLDERVNNGAALAGIRLADEEPVLLADGRGTNGIFDQVMPRPGLCRVAI